MAKKVKKRPKRIKTVEEQEREIRDAGKSQTKASDFIPDKGRRIIRKSEPFS